MAPFKFTSAIIEGRPIDVYGHGAMRRDFTYVDDLIAAVTRLVDCVPELGQPVHGDSLSAVAPFRVVNIAAGQPTELMDFIVAIEQAVGRSAILNMLPMQPGDVVATHSDTALLRALIGDIPETPVSVGVARFVEWYRSYYVKT
jgi:UDP-glucuronate 4-epimerase